MHDSRDALKLEQYKIYLDMKESFTGRNFNTNKFFMVFIFIIFVLIFTVQNAFIFVSGIKITSSTIFTLFGMGLCFLWWSNVDTYGTMMAIKYKDVIDKIEIEMPFAVHKMEKNALDELRKQKKAFLFADVQKSIATTCFIILMVFFLIEIVPVIVQKFHLI